MPEVTLTETDNGGAIEVRQGDVIDLQLRENPTTGFRWQVVRADGLDEEPLAADATPQGGEPGQPRIGAGGVRTLRFRARAPGSGRLELKLWRAFEGESSVVDRFTADITIAD
jgi:inhibitor of cysteine peptidase